MEKQKSSKLEEKTKVLTDYASGIIPERVPINVVYGNGFIIPYANMNMVEVQYDYEKMYLAASKV